MKAQIATPGAEAVKKKVLVEKWGAEAIAYGYTVVPSILLHAQKRLHITPQQLAVLIHLLDFWWKPGDMPWPKKSDIAERLGISEKSVQRAIAALEKEKILERDQRYNSKGARTSNRYILTGLVAKLKPLAIEFSDLKKANMAAKKKAQKPGLKKS